MASELEDLKAAMIVVCDVKFNGVDGGEVYMKGTVDAVIAHLEGELKLVREKLEEEQLRADSNFASRERVKGKFEKSYNEAKALESRLSECQERERKLREACEIVLGYARDCDDERVVDWLTAALEAKK